MVNIKTQREFLNEMLQNLQNINDKSPNSFSYDITSSAAISMQEIDRRIDEVMKKFDSYELIGYPEELEKRVLQISGLTRKSETKATGQITVEGINGTIVPKGTIFLADDIEYESIEEKRIQSDGKVKIWIECKEYGKIGNITKGLINKLKSNVPGVEKVYNEDEFHSGYEEETDFELWERHMEKLANPPKAGNIYHYREWSTEVQGVGYAKVFPCFNGPLTVEVVLIGMDHRKIDEILIKRVVENIEKERPFGVNELVVESAKEKQVDIDLKLVIQSGYTIVEIKEEMEEKLKDYFYQIAFKQEFISHAKLGALILSCSGVLDYTELKINNETENLHLQNDEVAWLGNLEVFLNE